ncbi:MAG: hypothetical protein M1830_008367 [Pleopsidium flavum]|nr:MAG: hypothetical protein M1830_008367 [Pleopsidium flavum]
MGSSSSKAAKTAAGPARRQYPQRVPPTSQPRSTTNAPSARSPAGSQPSAPGPTVHPQSYASGTRDEAINLDAQDPHFAASLRSLGAVTPSPTFSNSSTFNPSPTSSQQSSIPNFPSSHQQIFPDPTRNPAIQILQARDRLAQEAEQEFIHAGKRGHEGRQFLDVVSLRQVLMLRDEKGLEAGEIERRLGLRGGVVGRLGRRGIVGDTST